MLKQEDINGVLKPYIGVFTKTLGLLYAYKMKERRDSRGPSRLIIKDVHKHWRFKKPPNHIMIDDSDSDDDEANGFHNIHEYEEEVQEDNEDIIARGGLASPLRPDVTPDLPPIPDFLDILELAVLKTKGRPKGATAKKGRRHEGSTQREPSGFEYATTRGGFGN